MFYELFLVFARFVYS